MTVFAHGRSSASISRRVHRELWTHRRSKQSGRACVYVDSQKKLVCLGLLRVHEQAIKAKEDELVCMSIHRFFLSVSACWV